MPRMLDPVFFRTVQLLHQHCQAQDGFRALAIKLKWRSVHLADFFAGKSTTFEAIQRVAMALGLVVDVTFKPKQDNASIPKD